MRPAQPTRYTARGRTAHVRKGQNPLNRAYDSTGPDVKIRGTAQQIAEKYAILARDARSAGDRVMAENYLQHAEHYNRLVFTAQAAVSTVVAERSEHNLLPNYGALEGSEDKETASLATPSSGTEPAPVNPQSAAVDKPSEPVEGAAKKNEKVKRARRPKRPIMSASAKGETSAEYSLVEPIVSASSLNPIEGVVNTVPTTAELHVTAV